MSRRIAILLALVVLMVGLSGATLADPNSANRGFDDLNDRGRADVFSRGGNDHHDDDEDGENNYVDSDLFPDCNFGE